MTERSIELVLSTVTWEPDEIDRIRSGIDATEFVHSHDPAVIAQVLARADVAIIAGDLDDRHLAAPRLKWIHCDHAGLNKSARPDVFARGLLVTSSAGRSSDALAEHAFYFMLSHVYRSRDLLQAQVEHRWLREGRDHLRALFGSTVGIIGLGNTGAALAARCHAFGMRVLGFRRRAAPVPGVDRLYAAESGDSLDEILRESDFVVLATPLSDATHGMIGARELVLMKPTAFLVNMARGPVVDESALVTALRAGRLAGAGLDVFGTEPLPPTSPLWDLPGVYITPHATPAVPDKTARSIHVICENARRYRLGEPMINQLNAQDVWTSR
jgi:phosphoglycerate dehydrogenase-like enzyme